MDVFAEVVLDDFKFEADIFDTLSFVKDDGFMIADDGRDCGGGDVFKFDSGFFFVAIEPEDGVVVFEDVF